MYAIFVISLFLPTFYCSSIPLVVTTWKFKDAAQKGWDILQQEDTYDKDLTIDAIAEGCNVCQEQQCDYTVGYGGSPDENGETTLDAMIFDGDTLDMGAVGNIRRVKNVIAVARHVLENTEHSFLVGDLATNFAKNFDFKEESLNTSYSINLWEQWKENNCQPNFWKNVSPNPKTSCGPYTPIDDSGNSIFMEYASNYNSKNHDTIGMIAINKNGHIVAGTSTNGASHKIPGRVGDSPIPGAGGYADSEFGGAVATGDGDVMMRFLPSFLAVELMRNGATPNKAASTAISRITAKYPSFVGAVIAVNKKGEVGAACNGMDKFPYVLANEETKEAVLQYATCG